MRDLAARLTAPTAQYTYRFRSGGFFRLLANDNSARPHDVDGSKTGDGKREKPNPAR
jgi:hypothetical protein